MPCRLGEESMPAWRGRVEVKDQVLRKLHIAQASNRFSQGVWRDGTRGCAVSTVVECSGLEAVKSYAMMTGLPLGLIASMVSIYDFLPAHSCGQFAIDFAEAIAVGADTGHATSKIKALARATADRINPNLVGTDYRDVDCAWDRALRGASVVGTPVKLFALMMTKKERHAQQQQFNAAVFDILRTLPTVQELKLAA